MEVVLQTYYILLPVVATALLGWVGVLLKDQKKKEKIREEEIKKREQEVERIRKANSRGIMLVLRYMLKRYHGEFMIQGKITYNQYREWTDMFKTYTELEGNSIACKWNEDVEKMEKCDSASEMSMYEALIRQNMGK